MCEFRTRKQKAAKILEVEMKATKTIAIQLGFFGDVEYAELEKRLRKIKRRGGQNGNRYH